MRCWSLLFAIAVLVGGPVSAQPRPLQVGMSAGGVAATQTHNTSGTLRATFETTYLFGPAASVFFIKPLMSRVAVRGEVGALRKGHRRTGGPRPDVTESIRLDVFSIRLGGEAGMPIGGGVWGYGVLVPRLDVLVGEESEFKVDGRGQGGQPTRLRYDAFVFGGVLGVGMRVDVGIGEALQLEGRIDQDITPAYSSSELTVRGRAFILSAGILF